MNIYTIFLISAVCLLSVHASKTPFKMAAQLSQKSKAAGEKCIKDVGASPGFVEEMFPWALPKNELNEKSLFCFTSTLGLIKDDGTYIQEKVFPVFASSDKFEDIKKAFAECSGVKRNNQYETVYAITDCFFDKAPIDFQL